MDVSLSFKGGGSFVDLPPIISTNTESIFLASAHSVFEYSVKTGNLIYKYQGCRERIIGFSYSNVDSFDCLIACSKSGQFVVWSATGSNKVKLFETVITTKTPCLKSFHLISGGLKDNFQVLISYLKNGNIIFSTISLKSQEQRLVHLELDNVPYSMDISNDKYFAVAQENTVHFADINTLNCSRYDMAKNNRTFTCIACHPKERVVLTGDNTGRVVVWQKIFSKHKSQAVFHWHTLPVTCLEFSPLGSYFYSGANECVLVKWKFDNVHEKSFLARLPAGVTQITASENGAIIAVATADNAVRIVDTSLKQKTLIQHLVLGKQVECGIVYDPTTRALVMNSNIGCVQFFSPDELTLLYNVDIVDQNKITDERDCKIENTEVRKVALSRNSSWMATVEERREKNISCEIRLKFWHFNNEKQTYELNTSIEYPHDSSINSIEFQPGNLKCVTVGNDKVFKIWQLTQMSTVEGDDLVWKCYSVGFYKDLSCRALSFSTDGSLIAIGFEPILTTWTPDSCNLKCSLVHPTHKEKIRFIEFGKANHCHLLVTAGASQLSVWNLLTLSMVWIVPLNKISILVADSLSSSMAVFTKSNEVYIFQPASPRPMLTSKDLLSQKDLVVAACFVPNKDGSYSKGAWCERSNLYCVTSANELYCISRNEETYEYTDIQNDDPGDSVFSKMVPSTRSNQVEKILPKHHLFDSGYQGLRQYLEAPLQTLPPIRYMCGSLLKSMVLQKENT